MYSRRTCTNVGRRGPIYPHKFCDTTLKYAMINSSERPDVVVPLLLRM